MRLIDADALLEKMKTTPRYFGVKFDIEEMPTAYDVEKVVEQIKVAKKTALDKVRMLFLIVTKRDLQGIVNICFDEAVKIVRKGGVD